MCAVNLPCSNIDYIFVVGHYFSARDFQVLARTSLNQKEIVLGVNLESPESSPGHKWGWKC